MRGSSHILAGSILGAVTANITGTDLTHTALLTLTGGVSALAPDLDINGTLSNRISLPKKRVVSLLALLGLVILASAWLQSSYWADWRLFMAGICLIALPPFLIKQKWLLCLTGIIIIFSGVKLSLIWAVLFGGFICMASLLPHRSLTHSMAGLMYFSVIGFYFETEVHLKGAFLAISFAYLSHLVMDMKLIPFNRRGIKPFLPFSKMEV